MTQGSNTPPGLHLHSSRIDRGGEETDLKDNTGVALLKSTLTSKDRTAQPTTSFPLHRPWLQQHAELSCLHVSQFLGPTGFQLGWPTGPGYCTRVPGPAEPREPVGDYSIQHLLHSEGHSQSHIPSTSASSSGSPRRCLLLTFTVAFTG